MFLVNTKTLLIEALRETFDASYPTQQFRDIWVSMEYPIEEANYPGIWVDFIPTQPLQIAGINHTEWSDPGLGGGRRKNGRWRFAGQFALTCVAMTSLQRDRLVDEVVQLLAFGQETDSTARFRSMLEGNDLIALSCQWDTFGLGGKAETPGTPWGTDDVVYEMTVSFDCQGEIVSDGTSRTYDPITGFEVGPAVTEIQAGEVYPNLWPTGP